MLPSDISCVILAWWSIADCGTKFNAFSDLLMASTSISLVSGDESVSILSLRSAATVSLRSCVYCTCLAQSVFSPGDMLRLS